MATRMSTADPVGIWPSLDIACFGDAADDRNDQDLRLVQGIICAAWTNGQNLMPHSLRGAGTSHAGCSCSSRARARVRSIGKIKRFLIVTIFVGRRIHGSRPGFGQSSDPASDCRSVSSSRQAGDRISRAAGTASIARSLGAEQPVSGFHRSRAPGPELLGAQPHADPPRQEAVVPGLA
jgi:hypothetical protein